MRDNEAEVQRLQIMLMRLNRRELFDCELLAKIEELQHLLARNIGIDCQKRVDTLASLQKVDESLNRNPRSRKARHSVHDIFVDGDDGP